MTEYTVQPGDSFDTISRRAFGDGGFASIIASGNPGVTDPPEPGTVITLPGGIGRGVFAGVSGAENEVAISIAGKRFSFWETMSLRRSFDAVDTLELTAPFEPDDANFREVFKPLSFQDVVISIGSDVIFTGTAMDVSPELGPTSRTVVVSCYAKPGVLGDCTFPASLFPDKGLERNDQNLREISDYMIAPFGLKSVFTDAPGAPFETVACNPERNALDFLADLARQRGFVMGSDGDGNLVYRKSINTSPVARFQEGEAPLVRVSSTINPQAYYSVVSGVQPTALYGFGGGGQYSAKNERLRGILRPHTFQIDDARDGDSETAVKAKLGRMFANAVSYDIEVAGWRDVKGALWDTGTSVTLNAPGAMVYDDYLFMVRNVSFSKNRNEEYAVLTLTLPGAFASETPEALPWE